MTTPLLSLAVPTYNRPDFLDKLLASVADEILRDTTLLGNIEVVVSDNASEPSTLEIVQRWEVQMPNTITYRRNSTNLGWKINLVAAFMAARGSYVMYIGDDDRIRNGALNNIRQFIHAQGMPPVCLFADPNFLGAEAQALGSKHTARISPEDAARSYFFCAGIPGGAAIRTDLVRASLAHAEPESLFKTNWPQTAATFIAAIESGIEQPIAVQHERIAHVSEHHDANTIHTASTLWNTWVQGLVVASHVVETLTGRPFLSAACADIFTPRRLHSCFERTVDHILFVDTPDEVASFSIELERTLDLLPSEYQGKQRELLDICRTPSWLRTPTIIWRKLFASPMQVLHNPKLILHRIKSLRHLIRYYSRHRAKVKRYAKGIGKNVRFYSREGY